MLYCLFSPRYQGPISLSQYELIKHEYTGIGVGADAGVYAFNTTNGAVVWNVYLDCISCSPIVANGMVYPGLVYQGIVDGSTSKIPFVPAYDATTGAEKWRYVPTNIVGLERNLQQISNILLDGILYVCVGALTIVALNPMTGAMIWSITLSVEEVSMWINPNVNLFQNKYAKFNLAGIYDMMASNGMLYVTAYCNAQHAGGAYDVTYPSGKRYIGGMIDVYQGFCMFGIDAKTGSIIWTNTENMGSRFPGYVRFTYEKDNIISNMSSWWGGGVYNSKTGTRVKEDDIYKRRIIGHDGPSGIQSISADNTRYSNVFGNGYCILYGPSPEGAAFSIYADDTTGITILPSTTLEQGLYLGHIMSVTSQTQYFYQYFDIKDNIIIPDPDPSKINYQSQIKALLEGSIKVPTGLTVIIRLYGNLEPNKDRRGEISQFFLAIIGPDKYVFNYDPYTNIWEYPTLPASANQTFNIQDLIKKHGGYPSGLDIRKIAYVQIRQSFFDGRFYNLR